MGPSFKTPRGILGRSVAKLSWMLLAERTGVMSMPRSALVLFCLVLLTSSTRAQSDSGDSSAADWEAYLQKQVARIESETQRDLDSIRAETWDQQRHKWQHQLVDMLGMSRLLEPSAVRRGRSPKWQTPELRTRFVGTLQLEGVSVKRLHYESSPGLYVAANLYIPCRRKAAIGISCRTVRLRTRTCDRQWETPWKQNGVPASWAVVR